MKPISLDLAEAQSIRQGIEFILSGAGKIDHPVNHAVLRVATGRRDLEPSGFFPGCRIWNRYQENSHLKE